MQLVTFLLITLLFWAAGGAVLKIFYAMIQAGGALDIVFGWQRMLEGLYGSTSKWKNLLGKALGDCQQCTAFWFMPAWYLCYYAFCKIVLHYWITDSLKNWVAIGFVNWLWMTVFWSIGAVFGLFIILKKKKDV